MDSSAVSIIVSIVVVGLVVFVILFVMFARYTIREGRRQQKIIEQRDTAMRDYYENETRKSRDQK